VLSGNGKGSLNPILDPDGKTDHYQHLAGLSPTFSENFSQIPSSFLCNLADKLFALSNNGKEFENPILYPDADLDHHRNLVTSKLGQV